jgi:hypothetical protein
VERVAVKQGRSGEMVFVTVRATYMEVAVSSRARESIIRSALILMGVFTAVPVHSLVEPGQLEAYGVADPDPIVLTLLQHRGVFQLLGFSGSSQHRFSS